MLVYVRPSNEALLRARVPGAQDQRGCPSNPLIVRVLRARRTVCLLPRLIRNRMLRGHRNRQSSRPISSSPPTRIGGAESVRVVPEYGKQRIGDNHSWHAKLKILAAVFLLAKYTSLTYIDRNDYVCRIQIIHQTGRAIFVR